MTVYVEVAINLPKISETYHYHLPEGLEDAVQPGSLVIVPFGNQRVQGIVLGFVHRPEVAETKPVEELIDEKPALTPTQMALAQWLADQTLSSLGTCIHLMLPPGLSQRTDTLIKLKKGVKIDEESLSSLEKQIITLLKERGPLRGRQIDAKIRHIEWRGTLRKLARAGLVTTRGVLPAPRVKPKTIRKVRLVIDSDQIEGLSGQLSRVGRVDDRRMHVLRVLADEKGLLEPSWIYSQTGGNAGDLRVLKEADLIEILNVQVWRDPLEDATYIPTTAPRLTKHQSQAWTKIDAGLASAQKGQGGQTFLLHGVTGSGKTELYLRAVEETLAAGKKALVLVPEISLTPQTVKRFLSRFPGKVGVVHSKLSEGERYDTWRRVRLGEIPVIIGPRSALFMPQEDLGLIVMDECDDESYDQQDRPPFYRGVKTALACARLSGAVAILGSATPRVTQYFQAMSGSWRYIELPHRILAHRESIANVAKKLGIDLQVTVGEVETADLGLPKVDIVDMREELKAGNRSIFSRELSAAIEKVLRTDQQAILFLNRRGSATYVFCRDCGFVIKCPRDDKPLTYHQSQRALLCHSCGYQRKLPKTCPQCGSKHIRQLGTGTEKVEQQIKVAFPGVRTLRWDAETTRVKGAHERILTYFSNHQADILIGTQMLAKGLDLPLVTLVGVILAEVGLNLPDYRATERTFQLLTQVAGRAGRSPLGGRAIFQTYVPNNYVIQAAAGHDFNQFYGKELAYRRDLGYPPFKQLVRLEYRHYDPDVAQGAAEELAGRLKGWIAELGLRTEIIGPAPCFFSKSYGTYRWQLVLRGSDPTRIIRDRQPPDWIVEVDPSSLL